MILFVDAYNVILSQGPEFLFDKFENLKPARIVFGAEDICWPDEALKVNILEDFLLFFLNLFFVV